MNNNIEITSHANLDEIIYNLQTQLSTKELIDFCLNLGLNLSDGENFYKGLKNKTKKLKI